MWSSTLEPIRVSEPSAPLRMTEEIADVSSSLRISVVLPVDGRPNCCANVELFCAIISKFDGPEVTSLMTILLSLISKLAEIFSWAELIIVSKSSRVVESNRSISTSVKPSESLIKNSEPTTRSGWPSGTISFKSDDSLTPEKAEASIVFAD